MPRGQKITSEVINVIGRVYLDHPKWSAKEIRTETNKRLRTIDKFKSISHDWPGISAVKKLLTDIHRDDRERSLKQKGLDMPWSIRTLPKYPIPPEALPKVLEAWGYSADKLNTPLSIREALWVGRLYKVYENKRINELTFMAIECAAAERTSEIKVISLSSFTEQYLFKHELDLYFMVKYKEESKIKNIQIFDEDLAQKIYKIQGNMCRWQNPAYTNELVEEAKNEGINKRKR